MTVTTSPVRGMLSLLPVIFFIQQVSNELETKILQPWWCWELFGPVQLAGAMAVSSRRVAHAERAAGRVSRAQKVGKQCWEDVSAVSAQGRRHVSVDTHTNTPLRPHPHSRSIHTLYHLHTHSHPAKHVNPHSYSPLRAHVDPLCQIGRAHV